MYCRSQERIPLYIDGDCSSGSCVCINQDSIKPTTTTLTTPVTGPTISTTTRFSGTCKFKVVFENENDLLVVREPDLEASVVISIEASNPGCILQNSVTVRVSTQKYTATESLDYTGGQKTILRFFKKS